MHGMGNGNKVHKERIMKEKELGWSGESCSFRLSDSRKPKLTPEWGPKLTREWASQVTGKELCRQREQQKPGKQELAYTMQEQQRASIYQYISRGSEGRVAQDRNRVQGMNLVGHFLGFSFYPDWDEKSVEDVHPECDTVWPLFWYKQSVCRIKNDGIRSSCRGAVVKESD